MVKYDRREFMIGPAAQRGTGPRGGIRTLLQSVPKARRYNSLIREAALAGIAFIGLCSPGLASAQSDDLIDAIRELARENFDPVKIGAGYAAMVDFAVSPDISSANFYPDASDGVVDPSLKHFQFPLRFVFGDDESAPRPFLQAVVAHQTVESGFDYAPGEFIASEWETWGFSLSGGYDVPLSEHLSFLPVLSVGYGSLDNRARYSGPISEQLLQPALAGLVFDWDTSAVTYGASLGFDYRRTLAGFDVEVLGNVSHHYVESIDAPNEFVDFRSRMSAFDLDVRTIHPTPWKMFGNPLSIVGLFGNTRIFGPERDALGFDSFFEAGAGVDLDVSARGWKLKSLRFGVKAIFGPDVDGWGLIIGYRL
jgi:hypothetical protein